MTKPQLRAVDNNQPHARDLARIAIAKHRKGMAIDLTYDFSAQSVELRMIVYQAAVRFSRRRLWSRILR